MGEIWGNPLALLPVGLVIGYFLGHLFGHKAANAYWRRQVANETSYYERASFHDRWLMLSTLRREIANYLIQRDPEGFVRLYEKAHSYAENAQKFTPEHKNAELKVITDKFPQYEEFDLIGTWEYVLYTKALETHSDEEIEEHWSLIVRFQALKKATDPEWRHSSPTSETQLEKIRAYALRVKDTKFKDRIDQAYRDCNFFRSGREVMPKDDMLEFENEEVSICYIPHFAEIRRGFFFKDTAEYGMYSSFVFDDGKTHRSYYRCEPGFENPTPLNDLRFG